MESESLFWIVGDQSSDADCGRCSVVGVKRERGARAVGTATNLSPGKVVIPLHFRSEVYALLVSWHWCYFSPKPEVEV